jgi:carboxyl-terminal processing protease
VAALVNGATAGSGEALASLLQAQGKARVLGESTYGLGAEVKLFELDNGAGLLVSSALWETGSGQRGNGEGVGPDETIAGRGEDYSTAAEDQLERALELLEQTAAEAGAATPGAA